MKIQIIVKQTSLSENERQLIDRIISGMKLGEYEIVNIKYYRVKVEDTIYLVFGSDAAKTLRTQIDQTRIIELPELHQLFDKPQNETYRINTFQKLNQLSEYIKQLTTPSEIKLPPLSEKQLLHLAEQLKSKNIKAFTALNSDGKTIRIRIDESDTENADIIINIYELITLKLIEDIFGIKEFRINGIERKENGRDKKDKEN